MRIQSKFLSVLLVFFLLFSRSLVFAQEVTPTPTPAETPTPTDDPTTDEYNNSSEYSDSNQESVGPNGENLGPDDVSTIISSKSATIDVAIINDNDALVDRNVDTTNSTGFNEATENIDIFNELVIKSGDAIAQENHSNILNTNIIGEYIIPAIVNFFTANDGDYDYSDIKPCTQQYSPILSSDINLSEADGNKVLVTDIYQRTDSLGITNNNDADVENNINVDALTGGNKSLDNIAQTSIDSGDAHIDVNLFNMINTNLIGECGFFGVYNFFTPQTNSLILPNDDGFIGHQSDPNTITSLNIANTNSADSKTETNATTNTGENTLYDSFNYTRMPTIYSGDATSDQDVHDLTNASFTLDNFAFLKIQHFGNWTGNLVGWDGLILEGDGYILLIKEDQAESAFDLEDNGETETELIGDETSQSTEEIERNVVIYNNNNAYLRNNLDLNADTGHNEANNINAEIATGNALIEADIFNMLNTNITGKNWYFGVINIFDTFAGDIIFPRADVSVDMSADKAIVQANDTFTYRINYANIGQLPAENVSLVAVLPSDVKILSTTKNVSKSGQTLSWSLGKLDRDQSGAVYVQVQVNPSNSDHILMATSVIHTTAKEVATENNSDQASTTYKTSSSSNGNGSSQQTATQPSNQSSPSITPTPTTAPTVLLTNRLNTLQKIAGTQDSIESLEDQTEAASDKATSEEGNISLNGIFKTCGSWGPIALAYVLGVLSTLAGIRLKRMFLG